MSESRIREHLRAFGLSTTEIETYLAVVCRGAATTGEVADAADVTVADTGTDDERTLEGVPVREAKQSLAPPVTSDFPVENALVVETESGPASVGGDSPGFDPYFEDFAARSITLREP